METQVKSVTFVLTNKATWSRQVNVLILNKDKKYEQRPFRFETKHIVPAKQRTERGRQVAAEFTTSNPVEIQAAYKDSSYGITFVEKGDPEGKKKQQSMVINEEDKQIVALRGLYSQVGLTMDESLPINVLKEQYEIHVSALSGKKIAKSTATEIPHSPVNVAQEIADQKQAVRNKYEEDYGDPVPQIVWDDSAFLDGLSNPNFDPEKYIENKKKELEEAQKTEEEASKTADNPGGESEVSEKDKLHEAYFLKFEKRVPNMKVNDLSWIKEKLGLG